MTIHLFYSLVIRIGKLGTMSSRIILTILIALIGHSSMAEEVQKIDPSKILYTTPSIPNELPPMEFFDGKSDVKIFLIHEDNWSQIEFLNSSQLEEAKEMMLEYHKFEAKNRREVGWKNVYVRRMNRVPLFKGIRPKQKLISLLSAEEGQKPIVHSSSSINGMVRNGFTISVGNDVALYGYTDGIKMKELGALLGENPDNQSLVSAFSVLNKKYGLVLIDWNSQFIITGLDDTGELLVWRP